MGGCRRMLDVNPASPAEVAWPLARALVRYVLRTRLALRRQIKSGGADVEQIVARVAMHLSSGRPNHASSTLRAAEGAFREAELEQAWARLVAQASAASGKAPRRLRGSAAGTINYQPLS